MDLSQISIKSITVIYPTETQQCRQDICRQKTTPLKVLLFTQFTSNICQKVGANVQHKKSKLSRCKHATSQNRWPGLVG